MRKLMYIAIALFLYTGALHSNELLTQAEKAYDQKNYKEAIRLYKQLTDEGNSSFELYYNLGNSYYRNKELGYAIYYYELARKLNPNDQDVQINLGLASSKTIDKIDARENFFVNAVKSNIVHVMSINSWAWLSIVLSFLTCLLFFIFLSSRMNAVKRFSFLMSIVFFLSLLVVYGFGKSALNSKKENKFAIVLSKEVKVNNEPTSSAVLKFTLHEGTKVRILEANSDWVLIKLDNGNEGWIKQADIGII